MKKSAKLPPTFHFGTALRFRFAYYGNITAAREELRVSPRYLSDMLRTLTGQNAQRYIHNKVIEKVKNQHYANQIQTIF